MVERLVQDMLLDRIATVMRGGIRQDGFPNTESNALTGYKQLGSGKDYRVLGTDKFLKIKNIAIKH